MGKLIDGRTPEEIKRGLRWIAHDCDDDGEDCSECECVEECHTLVEDDVARDALALIERLEAAQPKWISVKERLPETNKYCLVAIKVYGYGDMYSDVAMYDGELWVQDAGAYFDIIDKGEVTHWMPMPEPPEEDAHDARKSL